MERISVDLNRVAAGTLRIRFRRFPLIPAPGDTLDLIDGEDLFTAEVLSVHPEEGYVLAGNLTPADA